MKKFLLVILIVISFAASSAMAGIIFQPKPVMLEIENVTQEHENWCWAAIVQQLTAGYGGPAPLSQCQLVNEANADQGVMGQDCCQENPEELSEDSLCSRFANQFELVTLINRHGGWVYGVALPNSPEEVREYLEAGQALIVGIKIDQDRYHAYLVRGISWEGEQAMLTINDPAKSGSQTVPYDQVRPEWIMTQVVKKS